MAKKTPSTTVRALRDEPRTTVGNWSADLTKGTVYQVSEEVGDELVTSGVAIDCDADATDNPHFDSEDPTLSKGEK